MKKEVIYRYLGTNGTLDTPIHLEDVYYVRMLRITADSQHALKRVDGDSLMHTALIPEEELDQWEEVLLGGKS